MTFAVQQVPFMVFAAGHRSVVSVECTPYKEAVVTLIATILYDDGTRGQFPDRGPSALLYSDRTYMRQQSGEQLRIVDLTVNASAWQDQFWLLLHRSMFRVGGHYQSISLR